MPGIVQLQRQYSPFQRMLPQFLSNLYFQNSAQRYQTQRAEEERKQQEEDTLRQYKTKGYRESEAHIPDVEVAGKGLMAPKPEFEIKTMGGKPFLVKSQKKYGGETTPMEMTELKTTKEGKVWVHNPKSKIKMQVSPDSVPAMQEQGWQLGQSYAPAKTPEEELNLYEQKQNIQLKKSEELAKFNKELDKKYSGTTPETMSPNQRRLLEKDLATMAITIESDKTSPAVKQATEFFNQFATGNSIYLWKKTKRKFLGDKEEAVRVDLPIRDGKQITAEDIRATLADPKNQGKTLEELLIALGAIE